MLVEVALLKDNFVEIVDCMDIVVGFETFHVGCTSLSLLVDSD